MLYYSIKYTNFITLAEIVLSITPVTIRTDLITTHIESEETCVANCAFFLVVRSKT